MQEKRRIPLIIGELGCIRKVMLRKSAEVVLEWCEKRKLSGWERLPKLMTTFIGNENVPMRFRDLQESA